MKEIKPVSEWKETLTPVLLSKQDEFRLLGYRSATAEDIWRCVNKKLWKNNPEKRLHEAVQDVLHLSNNQYVSYITVEAYQNDDLMESIKAVDSGSSEK
ncbi:post-transcriptional regulator [Halobacillus sp. A1]|uniref:post-transcriptional regulator n=1 Tax=Halobacillus sp. A1 TaxID=2880262 RepID=UPI0020A6A881|nr:post-transcriptional regulator [Halobacillus sp. A1]MCP3030426.1 post-transcriptional regulator [Halobacillus sp. A1]